MRALIGFVFALLLALPAAAQDMAALVADSVAINGNSQLVAEGNVEVLYQGRRLTAGRIVYDRTTDTLTITGPIRLTEGTDGANTVILADMAELSGDMTNGILRSARIVLNQQLQLAAAEIQRVDGRYTQMSRTVASSCQVCAANPVPLWEIRARRVVHDQLERQLYFDGAQFRVMGLPVFYLPRLRMPDPTLERATGFLIPSVRSTSALGTGIKVPYFIKIGDHRDLTLTPYLSTGATRTLEARYRQAFRNGRIEANGAISRDDLRPGEDRGYLFADGSFALRRGFELTFTIETVSDRAYLLDYGLSQKDRLLSEIAVTRTRRNEYIGANLRQFHSIREGEDNATLPSVLADVTYHRRFQPAVIGGEGGLRFQTHGHYRRSNLAIDGPDDDTEVDGRDVGRASVRLDWRRNWVMPGGIVGSALGEVSADAYGIAQDDTYPTSVTQVVPVAAVEFRWPWVRAGRSGASHVIEPIAQLAWSPDDPARVPNEDSALVEFDEGNLFSLNRFSGVDRIERGGRMNLGLGWTRYDPAGWSVGVTVGRVFRGRDLGQFGAASGLDERNSNWLAAVQLSLGNGFSLTNRAIFGDGLGMTKSEMRLAWEADRFGLASSYIWMVPDLTESRPEETSEFAFDGRYRFTQNWTGLMSGRYDFVTDRTASAGLGLEYRNECVRVDLSLSRRFTSSTSVTATTDFGLTVDLVGFGGSKEATAPSRVCRR